MMSEVLDERGDLTEHASTAMFERDNIAMLAKHEDGSIEFA